MLKIRVCREQVEQLSSSNSLLLGSELNVNIEDLCEKTKDIQEVLLSSFLNFDLVNLKFFDFFSLKKVHSIIFVKEKIKGAISVYSDVNCCPKKNKMKFLL